MLANQWRAMNIGRDFGDRGTFCRNRQYADRCFDDGWSVVVPVLDGSQPVEPDGRFGLFKVGRFTAAGVRMPGMPVRQPGTMAM